MELEISRQITEAAATLLAGLGLGLIYEVLGVMRRRRGRVTAALLDVGFCVLFAWTLFLLGMGPGEGTLRLYMAPLMLCGGALWVYLFGGVTRRWTADGLDALRSAGSLLLPPVRYGKKVLKKLAKKLKNIF